MKRKRCHPVVSESRHAPLARVQREAVIQFPRQPYLLSFVRPVKQTGSLSPRRAGLHFPLHLKTFPISPLLSSTSFNLAFFLFLLQVQQISVRSPDTVGLGCQMNHCCHPFCTNHMVISSNQQIRCDYQTYCAAAGSCTLIPEETNSRSRNKSVLVAARSSATSYDPEEKTPTPQSVN